MEDNGCFAVFEGFATGVRYQYMSDLALSDHWARESRMDFITYTICKKPDGTFDIYQEATSIHASVVGVWLERKLIAYGILEKLYDDVVLQLAETAKARVQILL